MHPDLDHLNKKQRKKLAQLDKLERKGWDISDLKQKIIAGDRKIDDDFWHAVHEPISSNYEWN